MVQLVTERHKHPSSFRLAKRRRTDGQEEAPVTPWLYDGKESTVVKLQQLGEAQAGKAVADL